MKHSNIKQEDSIKSIFDRFLNISRDYNEIFRDGQETGSRNFDFAKKTNIDNGENDESVKIILELNVCREKATNVSAKLVSSEPDSEDSKKFEQILNALFGKEPDAGKKWCSRLTDFTK